jgi:hypothetical protein
MNLLKTALAVIVASAPQNSLSSYIYPRAMSKAHARRSTRFRDSAVVLSKTIDMIA